MNWDRLIYFRTVARLQHVSRAAEELGVTQPALSRAISRLERDVGTALFDRQGRAIALTPYGVAFLRHVERAIDAVEAGRREVADLASDAAAHVSLGFLRTLGAAVAPQLIRAYLTNQPNVRFAFTQSNGIALEAKLLGGDLSLALIARPSSPERLQWERFTTQHFVLIVPAGHRLASRRRIELATLRGETFVTFKPGHILREFTETLCANVGFKPAIAFEADESNSIRGFVNAGFGIAIVPQTEVGDELPTIPLVDPSARREIGIACVAGRPLSDAERDFRSFVLGNLK